MNLSFQELSLLLQGLIVDVDPDDCSIRCIIRLLPRLKPDHDSCADCFIVSLDSTYLVTMTYK